jgi:hypothetical protein
MKYQKKKKTEHERKKKSSTQTQVLKQNIRLISPSFCLMINIEKKTKKEEEEEKEEKKITTTTTIQIITINGMLLFSTW